MLKDIIQQRIAQDGFITIADYTRLCLLHPEHGYYTTQTVFGADGDFTTAPECSQLFGEMLGVWAMLSWERLGKPSAFDLIELGPGRGTLMRDLLRAVSHLTDFTRAVHVHCVEASPLLRQKQRDVIAACSVSATWHDTIETVPFARPTLVVANEFFDALPVRQFVVQDGAWHERVIVMHGDQFGWSTHAAGAVITELPNANALDTGTVYEQATDAWSVFSALCQKLAHASGAMAVIDYGDYLTPRFGDTLQSMKRHAFVDVLTAWDRADITTHVDFHTLESLARKHDLRTALLMQREFLHMHGIDMRMERLCDGQDTATQAVVKAGYERLTDPAQMGHLFKVLMVETP